MASFLAGTICLGPVTGWLILGCDHRPPMFQQDAMRVAEDLATVEIKQNCSQGVFRESSLLGRAACQLLT